ncbi:hypothetical protein EDB92DRAFT_1818288 [Lactarius akahatsu]|uniref:Uncharacterized protein n=1 Tax=Lactarius akahatsu TaxID=416441 RepID=A0AAD4LCC8_9AGAM|nr:hypothetical protein EDB92DRAFT_1818288 [Lactarius akahatsu]
MAALKALVAQMPNKDKEGIHWHGTFLIITHEISFGGGQPEPQYLHNDIIRVEKLMENPEIQRICNFASCAFESYEKKNFEYMKTTMEKLRQKADEKKDRNKQLDDKLRLRRPYDGKIGEKRFCITQFAAGGLFRWVENRCMSDIDWMKQANKEEQRARGSSALCLVNGMSYLQLKTTQIGEEMTFLWIYQVWWQDTKN